LNCRFIFNEACIGLPIPLTEKVWDVTSCRTETETVSRMEKTGPSDCCYRHQSVPCRRRHSSCVRAHAVDTFSTFCCDVFIVQCVKLMLSKFLHLWFFYCNCFVVRQNVGLTCLKYLPGWALHRWGGRHRPNHSQIHNCFLNRSTKD